MSKLKAQGSNARATFDVVKTKSEATQPCSGLAKKNLLRFLVVILLLFLSLSSPLKIYSVECDTPPSEIPESNLEEAIEEFKQKITACEKKRDTLQAEINYMESQIYLTSLEIEETQAKIEMTEQEIESLTERIEGLNVSLDYLSRILVQKIVEGYKRRGVSFLEIFLNSDSASTLANRIKYTKITQDNDRRVAFKIQQAKDNFEEQKALREEKKLELAELDERLKEQKQALNYQKSQKQTLLAQTNNDEQKYQQLLQQALSEFEALERAIVAGVAVGPIKKGEPIALVGNSGYPYCSTGPHLHFEVRQGGSWVNAESYLAPHSVENEQDGGVSNIGSGSWDWPISDPIVLTQRYGKTPYSWRYTYSGGIHTGVDMYSRESDIIRAPKDGTLYTFSERCGPSIINIKYIDHGDGMISLYLHVQK